MDPDPTPATPSQSGRRARRLIVPVLSGLVALALVLLLVYGVTAQSPTTRIDERLANAQAADAPAYRLDLLDRGQLGSRLTAELAPALSDGAVSSTELRGRPYVLNFWASWCIPCQEEAGVLERAWQRERARGGLLFVGLNQQDIPGDARTFIDEFDVDYLTIRDTTNATGRRYGATGLPETYFVSARGQVVGHVIGVISDAQLQDGIAAARAGRPQAAREGGDRRSAR